MALFGRRPKSIYGRDGTALRDRQILTALAIRALIDRGHPVDPYPPGDPLPGTLIDGLGNLIDVQAALGGWAVVPEADWNAAVGGWADRTLAQLPPPQIPLDSLRSRILDEDSAITMDLDYARPFAPGLVEVLCATQPGRVMYVHRTDLPSDDLDTLFHAGRAGLATEPLGEVQDVADGIRALVGGLFEASRALDLGTLVPLVVGAAPHGVVFGVPHRHLLLMHAVVPVHSVVAITEMVRAVPMNADADAPGGALSAETYFCRDGVVQQITAPTADGGRSVVVSGAFAEAIDPG